MRLSVTPSVTFSIDAACDPFASPDALLASAKEVAGAFNLDPTVEAHFEQLRVSAIPWLVLPDMFPLPSSEMETPTVMRPNSHTGGREALNAIIGTLARARLEPVSFVHENGGDIGVHLAPMREDQLDRLSLAKSKGLLRGHTDASFNPSTREFLAGEDEFSPAPDFVVLAALRNPKGVPTRIARLSDVAAKLGRDDVAELQRSIFILSPQSTFDIPGFPKRVGPVLWLDDDGVLCCRFSHSNIAVDESSFPTAAAALDRFKTVLSGCFCDVVLGPGEVLIFNNRTLIHGRGDPGEGWSPSARWLIRCYARLRKSPVRQFDPKRAWIAC